VSYRDPNLIRTLETFDETAKFLRDTDLTDEELNKSIIGAIGDMDAHILPDTKGHASMVRYLVGDTEQTLQQIRDEVLGTCKADFKSFGNTLEKVKENGLVKVLGSQEAVEQALADRPGWLEVVKVL
jgi:hypothetical protein